jgi:hypothetical protein
MRKISATLLTVLIVFGTFVGAARSQSIIAEQEQQQRQIDELRSDVDELRRTIATLKKAALNQHVLSESITQDNISRPKNLSIDTLPPAEQEKIKAEICDALGLFFAQIEKALKMADSSEAEKFMSKAIAQLKSTIDKYGPSDRLRNLLSLADGLAWDTYTAVETRNSVYGNADFLNYIREYKTKYENRCGRQ